MLINIILLVAVVYFAKDDYKNARVEWAMFWSALFGWNLHTMLGTL